MVEPLVSVRAVIAENIRFYAAKKKLSLSTWSPTSQASTGLASTVSSEAEER